MPEDTKTSAANTIRDEKLAKYTIKDYVFADLFWNKKYSL